MISDEKLLVLAFVKVDRFLLKMIEDDLSFLSAC